MTLGLIAVAIAAVVDWTSVWLGRTAAESLAKPAVMIALIGTAVALDADPVGARVWMIGGVTFGLIGDVCLLPNLDRFIEGLGAFLVGHLLYVVALVTMFDRATWLLVGLLVAAVVVALLARPILRALSGDRLRAPVAVYMTAVAAVIVLGISTGRWPIAVGAVLFALSDGLLGLDRFVRPAPRRRVAVHVLYHLGQVGLVVGLHASFA